MDFLEQRRAEVLDGKRQWDISEAGGDPDVFLSEFVSQLRELKADGLFDEAKEVYDSRRGVKYVRLYLIISPINYSSTP